MMKLMHAPLTPLETPYPARVLRIYHRVFGHPTSRRRVIARANRTASRHRLRDRPRRTPPAQRRTPTLLRRDRQLPPLRRYHFFGHCGSTRRLSHQGPRRRRRHHRSLRGPRLQLRPFLVWHRHIQSGPPRQPHRPHLHPRRWLLRRHGQLLSGPPA
jgi:hypothetical protein